MQTELMIREMTGTAEMLEQLPLLQLLTPELTESRAEKMLKEMTDQGYRMIGAFSGKQCIGLSGIWINTKLYSGKYLEIDNFVVDPDYRSSGIGKKLMMEIEKTARLNQCECIMLDAYTHNNSAHKFYIREGFQIKGFHFIKKN